MTNGYYGTEDVLAAIDAYTGVCPKFYAEIADFMSLLSTDIPIQDYFVGGDNVSLILGGSGERQDSLNFTWDKDSETASFSCTFFVDRNSKGRNNVKLTLREYDYLDRSRVYTVVYNTGDGERAYTECNDPVTAREYVCRHGGLTVEEARAALAKYDAGDKDWEWGIKVHERKE